MVAAPWRLLTLEAARPPRHYGGSSDDSDRRNPEPHWIDHEALLSLEKSARHAALSWSPPPIARRKECAWPRSRPRRRRGPIGSVGFCRGCDAGGSTLDVGARPLKRTGRRSPGCTRRLGSFDAAVKNRSDPERSLGALGYGVVFGQRDRARPSAAVTGARGDSRAVPDVGCEAYPDQDEDRDARDRDHAAAARHHGRCSTSADTVDGCWRP